MKFLKNMLVITLLLSTTSSFAALITNGNFADSCNLNSWEQFGVVGISGTAGNCAAELSINDSDFEAELFKAVVFENDSDYLLSIAFDFNTSQASIVDSFFISFINADSDLYDLLLPSDFGIGSNSLTFSFNSADLINNYVNQDWRLSFYLYDEVFDDQSTSSVAISSVSLNKIDAQVPEPSGLAFLALGLAGLIGRRKLASGSVRLLNNK